MAEFTTSGIQAVDAGQNILLTETPVKGNCSIIHREGSGLITLRGITNQCRARFRVFYNANIAVPAGVAPAPISVALTLNGEPILSSRAISSPTVADRYNNVSGAVFIDVPAGCCTQVSLRNLTTIAINMQDVNVIVERVA